MKKEDHIQAPQGDCIIEELIKWLRKPDGENGYLIYSTRTYGYELFALLDVDAALENGTLYYLDKDLKGAHHWLLMYYVRNLLGIMFRYNLLKHEGLVIHASAISWNGKGIIFSAPSGTGKSTQARLWQDFFGSQVELINDDTPALRFNDGKTFVFGAPWSGNGDNNNISAPLAAIVILEQAPLNLIRKISHQEALAHLMPRCFLPYFDEGFMKLAVDIIEKIVLSVPVYLLQCRPDKEAVELACQMLK